VCGFALDKRKNRTQKIGNTLLPQAKSYLE
jgi:hypothetical protein